MKRRIVVGCNTLTQVDSLAYPSHCKFWYHAGRELTDWEFLFNATRRVSIDNMRNNTAQIALRHECDYIFFYDDDVLIPPDSLKKLLGRMEDDPDISVAAGLTYVRGYPFPPMLFKYMNNEEGDKVLVTYDDFEEHADENGIVEVGAVGFSCVLLRTEHLRDMTPPYFITGSKNTEDVYYCVRLKEHFPNVKIICDTTVSCSHIVERYVINKENHKEITKFEEQVFDAKPKDYGDRGQEYADMIKERLKQAKEELVSAK